MHHISSLFNSIELYSNHNSFDIGIDHSANNLWILNHLNFLDIQSYKIYYKKNTGYRQRESTKYPTRLLRKKFDKTRDLITYLMEKGYDIIYCEILFTNNWRFKLGNYVNMYFYTNSIPERNELIIKLFSLQGSTVKNEAINELQTNITYITDLEGKFKALSNLIIPDEFWSEEEVDNWKKTTSYHYN